MLKRKLIEYTPPEYAELLESCEILSAQDLEFARLHASIDELMLQFNVSTATWGLREWERICGIETDGNKPLGERRSVILARLRGAGVTTKAHIEKIAESFDGGDVEVEEKFAESTIVITFVSTLGIPQNLTDLTDILREIIPAHLAIEYKFKFVTYDMLKATGLTYDQLKATGRTYDDLKNGGI